jgi:hypothetical protein
MARTRKTKKLAASIYQMRQRELAWILYVTEGYIANLEHALAVNCVTFENSDHDAVAEMISAAREQADNLREALKNITKD